jgi:hypothetical protein
MKRCFSRLLKTSFVPGTSLNLSVNRRESNHGPRSVFQQSAGCNRLGKVGQSFTSGMRGRVRRGRRPFMLFFLLALIAGIEDADSAPACVSQTTALTGTLRFAQARHPAGHRMNSLQLTFRPPICVATATAGRQARLWVRSVDLVVSPRQAQRLRGHIGQRIRARGTIMPAHTAWHLGDAVMLEAAVLPIRARHRRSPAARVRTR